MKETVQEIDGMQYQKCGYKGVQELPKDYSDWDIFKRHDRVHGRDEHFWFHTEIDTPDVPEGKELCIELTTGYDGDWDATNPQGLLYLNGVVAGGLDVNHHHIYVKPNTHYDVVLYLYVGMIDMYIDVIMDVKTIDLPVKKLYWDMQVPYEAAMVFKETEYAHIETIKYLEATCNKIDFRKPKSEAFYQSIQEATRFLQKEYYEKRCGKEQDVIVDYVGHTHIDVAWLWTLAQTREKVQRTFSTVLQLMERYPNYIFFSSQPQLLEYLKIEEPELYKRLKERVKEGRFEIDGAMWLEADCNLPSGESLIRQVQHGKKFMMDEYGVDSKTLWLPDVFGYSAALPQILTKSGVNKFVTSKISWNETNKMPYDTFYWQGIDGTEIFSYFMTARKFDLNTSDDNNTTYVGDTSPSMLRGTWERYQQKEYNTETVVTFGYGDGGGGPTEEMLEMEERLEKGLPGLPRGKMSRADEFLSRAKANFDASIDLMGRRPKWVGELYLEKHRGTYTSIAKNKKNNRKSEFLLLKAEEAGVLSKLLLNGPYASDVFYRNWRTVLLNQFHDIIPGSSIHQVYEESDKQYATLRKEVTTELKASMEMIAKNVKKSGVLVYNPNGFVASEYVSAPDGTVFYAENVPATGYKVYSLDEVLEAEKTTFEPLNIDPSKIDLNDTEEMDFWDDEQGILSTPFYEIKFDDEMTITSLYDLENEREVVADGGKLNRLRVYENYPYDFDNWELCNYHEQKFWDVTDVVAVEPFKMGGMFGLKVSYSYMDSVIIQYVTVFEKERKIEFRTTADWHEDHVYLKAMFPVDIQTEEMTSEIQYGHVKRPNHRNTSWDQAKFEVCAHKWSDFSEEGYGVAILNDCKYGYSACGKTMSLSLIKTGTYPDELADMGFHEFTYAILPHKGSFKEGEVIQEAYELNQPLTTYTALGEGTLPDEFSICTPEEENIIVESVKLSDSGDGIMVRLYESFNARTTAHLTFGMPAKEIILTDLLEKEEKVLGTGNKLELDFKNFEIHTIKLKF